MCKACCELYTDNEFFPYVFKKFRMIHAYKHIYECAIYDIYIMIPSLSNQFLVRHIVTELILITAKLQLGKLWRK